MSSWQLVTEFFLTHASKINTEKEKEGGGRKKKKEGAGEELCVGEKGLRRRSKEGENMKYIK